MEIIKFSIFLIGTMLLMAFSWWVSIKDRRYHGIYRFFSFESIYVILLFNIPFWFRNPFSVQQIFSWILLLSSIYFVFFGFTLLKRVGKPEGNYENTGHLVKEGVYRYIRHPMYFSLVLLGTGALLKDVTVLKLIPGVVNVLALIATAKLEEQEMIEKFGDVYVEYMKRTKMFIPFLF